MCNYFLNKLRYFKRVDYALMLDHLAEKYHLSFEQVEKEIVEYIVFHTNEVGVAKSVFYLKQNL